MNASDRHVMQDEAGSGRRGSDVASKGRFAAMRLSDGSELGTRLPTWKHDVTVTAGL
jgi:hypothetical protein